MNTTVSSINKEAQPIKRHEVMAGLSASRIGSFVAQFSTNDADLDSNGHQKSVDERAFSDFGIDGSEKDWKQDARSHANNSYNSPNEEQEKKETADMVRDQAMDEMREKEEERMKGSFSYQNGIYKFDGIEFTDEDLENTIQSIKDDPQAHAQKRGLTEEQGETSLIFLMELRNAPDEEKGDVHKYYKENHPEAYKAALETIEDTKAEMNNEAQANQQASTELTNSDNEVVTAVTKEDGIVASHAIESGALSSEQVEIVQEVAQNKRDTGDNDFDMFFDDDIDIAGSYSESISPEGNTQSIASNFSSASNPTDSNIVNSTQEFEKTKTLDIGNALT